MINLIERILPRQVRAVLRPYITRYRNRNLNAQGPQTDAALASDQDATDSLIVGRTPYKPRRTAMYEVDPSSEEFQKIFNQNWYYSIELNPGLYTKGAEHPNVICTRELLARFSPSGLDICDIGTMEGIIPVLLKRRGARRVIALDALDLTEKILLV
jgi:ribosomal protein L11 methylase PrmA